MDGKKPDYIKLALFDAIVAYVIIIKVLESQALYAAC